MRVGSVSNHVNFGKVYAVAGKSEQLKKLSDEVLNSPGYAIVLDATDTYRNSVKNREAKKAIKAGNDVDLFVAGKQDTQKIEYMYAGWSSIPAIAKHVDKFIHLKNMNDTLSEIREEMAKEEEN